MSFSFRAGGVRTGGRRPGIAAPTGRTERNVRQRRLRTSENEAEAQRRPGPTVRAAARSRGGLGEREADLTGRPPGVPPCPPAQEADPMDITTVNDRYLYQGRVVVQDPTDPSRQI